MDTWLVGKLLAVLGWLVPVGWKMPKVVIGLPQERPEPAEPYLRWWQIPVSVPVRKFWEIDMIEDCRILLSVDAPHALAQPLELLWPTKEGPKDKITLRVGEPPYLVPVVMRSEEDCWPTGDPVRLPRFFLPTRVARMSDANAIIHRTNFTDLPPSVWYRLTLQIRSGATEVETAHYRLRVPNEDNNNEQFILAPIEAEET